MLTRHVQRTAGANPSERGSVTEYVLITILVAIVVLFAVQRYGATLRGKTTEAGVAIDDARAVGERDHAGGAADGDEADVASVSGGSERIGENARVAAGDSGASARTGGGSGVAADASVATGTADDAAAARGDAFDAEIEETGVLPPSDEERGVDVLGFRITWSTAAWLALLVVAVGFAMIRQQNEKQKRAAKEMRAARAKRGSPA